MIQLRCSVIKLKDKQQRLFTCKVNNYGCVPLKTTHTQTTVSVYLKSEQFVLLDFSSNTITSNCKCFTLKVSSHCCLPLHNSSAVSEEPSKTRDTHPVLLQYWSTVFDAGPTLIYHWMNAPCLLGSAAISQISLDGNTSITINEKTTFFIELNKQAMDAAQAEQKLVILMSTDSMPSIVGTSSYNEKYNSKPCRNRKLHDGVVSLYLQ